MLKLYFGKAFDKIEHGMILTLLTKKVLVISGVIGFLKFSTLAHMLFFLMEFQDIASSAEGE